MPLPANIDERRYIDLVTNHRELGGTLDRLGHAAASVGLLQQAEEIALCWFRLAQEHLVDASQAEHAGRARSAYSRAYYAAYNASKALRYFANGQVSLLGDDHKRAGIDLPDDFPNIDTWSRDITQLLEHRQRADYDNWSTTQTQFMLTPKQCCDLADAFVNEVANFFHSKFGVKL